MANASGRSLVQMSFNETPDQIVLSGGHVFELSQIRNFPIRILNVIVMQLPQLTSDQTNTLNLIRNQFQVLNQDLHFFTWIDDNSTLYCTTIVKKFLDMQCCYNLFTDYGVELSNKGEMTINSNLRVGLIKLEQLLHLPYQNNTGLTLNLL